MAAKSEQPLVQVAYVSQDNQSLTDADLRWLMSGSRRRNRNRGVTGMLVIDRPHFLQILEGPERAVAKTLASIQRDDRHTAVEVIFERDGLAEREFARSGMSCKLLGTRLPSNLSELDERVKRVLRSEPVDGESAYQLLLDFRDVSNRFVDI